MKYRVVFKHDYSRANFDFDTVAEAGKFADSLNDNYSGEKEVKITIELVKPEEDQEEDQNEED